MPDLLIRLKRHTDGSASLTCTRADGSVTWQKQKPSLALVFPQHDLTHYAVESTLGYRNGFFGLLAQGWDISDFSSPWPRGPIPQEAREVELLVGFFDAERRSSEHWSADAFNAHAKTYVAASDDAGTAPTLTDGEIARVRATRNALLTRWFAVAFGDSLELEFECSTGNCGYPLDSLRSLGMTT